MTLNQLIDQITLLGTNHAQIKTVKFGTISDSLDNDVVYPLMNFDFTNCVLRDGDSLIGLQIFFLDRILPEESNLNDVLSDQLLICQDIISLMKNQANDYLLQGDVQFNFIEDETPDIIGGVVCNFNLELFFVSDRCQIPNNS